MELIQLFREGGFIMYPLLVCFIISIIVTADKVLTLKKFNEEVSSLDKDFTGNQLEIDLSKYNDVMTMPYSAMKEYLDEDEVSRLSQKTLMALKEKLWLLGTVTSSAPFIGLFGTVVGIIKSFASIGEAGKAGFAVVSADLSEALIATAAGILVAVVALLFYNFLSQRIKDSFFQYQFNLESHFKKQQRSDGK
jgi:biopolymer transport protein ExbB/TolQ